MKFLKIYFIGVVFVFLLLVLLQTINKLKKYKKTKKINVDYYWKETIYYSLYSFGFFLLELNEHLKDKFGI